MAQEFLNLVHYLRLTKSNNSRYFSSLYIYSSGDVDKIDVDVCM